MGHCPCIAALANQRYDHRTMPSARLLSAILGLALMVGCSSSIFAPPEAADVDLVLSDTIRLGDTASGIELYPLWGRPKLFTNWNFQWRRVPTEFRGKPAVRTALNRSDPVAVHAAKPGRLYAVLWKWDYGFLEQLPSERRTVLNGWKLVREDGGQALGAPAPFGMLALYALDLAPGTHRIGLSEYWGQYVIVGFVPSAGTVAPASVPAAASVDASLTRHHILDPETPFTLSSSAGVDGFSLYRNGALVQSGTGDRGTAPRESGRYVLQVSLKDGTRTIPLTVGFGRAASPGWEPGLFPIHFYNGWSYAGEFTPNPDLLLDLQSIAMFELGANAFFLNAVNDIVDALGGRTILLAKGRTMRFTRSATDTEEAARLFREELAALAPLPRNLLGLYVEDEPPAMAAGNLGAMERVMRETAPRIPLLYTLQGPHALEFWLTAGSTVRMTRAYPIRKSTRSDQKSSIKEELTDFLTSCQKRDQSHPLWVVLQAFGDRGRPNIWDPPTPAEIRLMVNLSLARGAKALTYFCFDSSSKGRENLSALAHWPFVPEDGRYAEVGRINALIREHRQLLASFTWVEEIAPARGNVDVQLLSSARGERYAWVTNWDARHTTSAFVRLPGRSGTEELTLDPGAGVIINLQTEERIGF